MANSSLLEDIRSGLTELVEDFIEFPHAHRTEQSMHCYLFHLLARRGLDQVRESGAGFGVRMLQKEYPPMRKESGRRHGLLDIVVFDDVRIRKMKQWDWRSLEGLSVAPAAAVELKLNGGLRWRASNVRLSDLDKELARLADERNQIAHPFLLYFYRIARYEDDESMVAAFKRLEQMFTNGASRFPRVSSWLISVEFDPGRRYGRYAGSILRFEDGQATRTVRNFDDLTRGRGDVQEA